MPDLSQVLERLKPTAIVRGPMLPEPVQLVSVVPMGTSVKLVGRGLQTNQVRDLVLSPRQLAILEITPESDGGTISPGA